MKKYSVSFFLFLLVFLSAHSQTDSLPGNSNNMQVETGMPSIPQYNTDTKDSSSVYTLKPRVDIPIIAVGTIWSGYAFTKIYKKPRPTEEQILNLKTENINSFDRWAAHAYVKSLDDFSYYPFYAAMPLPFIFFLTGADTRSDFAKLSFMYWETMAVTGLLGTGGTYFVDRYRPYAYFHDTKDGMDKATGSVAKNSFYAGHVQVVAAPTFFIAKVYADYHPDSKVRWVFYTGAALATASMGYMRLNAGEHFPSDILLGTATGVLAGILVPQSHKTKLSKGGGSMCVLPYSTGEISGIVLTYKF